MRPERECHVFFYDVIVTTFLSVLHLKCVVFLQAYLFELLILNTNIILQYNRYICTDSVRTSLKAQSIYSWFQTFAVFCMLYVFFWVIPRRLNFICRRFGTLCLFHLHRLVGDAPTCPWRWNRQSVPKRRHIKFRRREFTQKKAYKR